MSLWTAEICTTSEAAVQLRADPEHTLLCRPHRRSAAGSDVPLRSCCRTVMRTCVSCGSEAKRPLAGPPVALTGSTGEAPRLSLCACTGLGLFGCCIKHAATTSHLGQPVSDPRDRQHSTSSSRRGTPPAARYRRAQQPRCTGTYAHREGTQASKRTDVCKLSFAVDAQHVASVEPAHTSQLSSQGHDPDAETLKCLTPRCQLTRCLRTA